MLGKGIENADEFLYVDEGNDVKSNPQQHGSSCQKSPTCLSYPPPVANGIACRSARDYKPRCQVVF
jgi:hypothetical protein